MNNRLALTQIQTLLELEYGLAAPTLTSLHQFEHDDRGVYRVDAPGHPPYVLRAYQRERAAVSHLAGSATTLLFLEEADFPAPRIHRTKYEELIGQMQGWSTLLLTYFPGEMAGSTVAEFQQLGALLARLHCLDITQTSYPLPPCRWQPNQKIADWLTQLQAVAPAVPPELQGLHAFSIAILSQVLQWPSMPTGLLHADPNSFNAIRTSIDERILIDWDGAGVGPALLDLGYLLLTAHATLPLWPWIEANGALIAAIMRGYRLVRPLAEQEWRALPIAVCFNDAVWAAQAIPQIIDRDWRQNRTLTRFGTRYPMLAAIGEIAQAKR